MGTEASGSVFWELYCSLRRAPGAAWVRLWAAYCLCWLNQAAADPGPGSGPSFKTPGWLLCADARVSVCLNWFPGILDTIWTGKMTHKDSP